MIATNLQHQYQNWSFLGEGKAHIIFSYAEANPLECRHHSDQNPSRNIARIENANICVARGSSVKICEKNDADGDFVVADTTEIDGASSIEHQVLRLTKNKFSIEEMVRDELYINRVVKPWLSDSFCSERFLVSLSEAFLEGMKTF